MTTPHNLYAVYSGWLGGGAEAVLVEATSKQDARDQAWHVLRYQAERAGGTPRVKRDQIESYDKHHDSWEVELIVLPYITELS